MYQTVRDIFPGAPDTCLHHDTSQIDILVLMSSAELALLLCMGQRQLPLLFYHFCKFQWESSRQTCQSSQVLPQFWVIMITMLILLPMVLPHLMMLMISPDCFLFLLMSGFHLSHSGLAICYNCNS